MPCGWEGNRRTGVALDMRQRLRWFIHLSRSTKGRQALRVAYIHVLPLFHIFTTSDRPIMGWRVTAGLAESNGSLPSGL